MLWPETDWKVVGHTQDFEVETVEKRVGPFTLWLSRRPKKLEKAKHIFRYKVWHVTVSWVENGRTVEKESYLSEGTYEAAVVGADNFFKFIIAQLMAEAEWRYVSIEYSFVTCMKKEVGPVTLEWRRALNEVGVDKDGDAFGFPYWELQILPSDFREGFNITEPYELKHKADTIFAQEFPLQEA